MVRLIVESVAFDFRGQKVVLLKDVEGRRILPIWIGPAEARAIALELECAMSPRPLTHDLLFSTLHMVNASIMRVVINELTDDTFYATIEMDSPGGAKFIDSRPSDAIALAVRARCPIYATGNVLNALIDVEDLAALEQPLEPSPPVDEEINRFQRLVEDLEI